MAYCVHCGVKLSGAEAACPLCDTPVLDPAGGDAEPEERAFPVRTADQALRVSRRYAVSLLSLLLLLPAAVCVLIDALGGGGISWSIYPAGVLVLTWIAVTAPLLLKRNRLLSTILITGGTLLAYLYMVERMTGAAGWFLPIVLPAVALGIGMLCLTVWCIRRKKLRLLRLTGLMLLEVGVLCFFVELLCVLSGASPGFRWSAYVITPCAFLALLLYVISKNGPLSTELKRRFHF